MNYDKKEKNENNIGMIGSSLRDIIGETKENISLLNNNKNKKSNANRREARNHLLKLVMNNITSNGVLNYMIKEKNKIDNYNRNDYKFDAHEDVRTITSCEVRARKLYLIPERLLKHSRNLGETDFPKNHLHEINMIINNLYLEDSDDYIF
jgi:hypothetical protein